VVKQRAPRAVRKYKQSIVAYTETGLSNGVMKGINNKMRTTAAHVLNPHAADGRHRHRGLRAPMGY
jgi:hypothetical protein